MNYQLQFPQQDIAERVCENRDFFISNGAKSLYDAARNWLDCLPAYEITSESFAAGEEFEHERQLHVRIVWQLLVG
jgi:hypothetical protein